MLGFLGGLARATSWIRENHCWHYDMFWLVSGSYADRLGFGSVIGIGVGSLVAVPVILLLPAVERSVA